MATIQGVYMALFGRPADPKGLEYFNSATGNGANLTAIGDLAATTEYQGRFVGMSNSQIVTSIFQSLYNRSPDTAGLTFFTNALTSGSLNINNIAIAIYDGAQGADLTMRNLKETAANAFTAAIDTTAEINGYSGPSAAASGVTFLAGVTTTAPSLAQVDAAVLAATNSVVPPLLFALTSQLGETITGRALDDMISAVLNAANPSSATGTFNTGDVVNGGGGTDTLNITVTTAGALLPAGASVSNVEIVNINQSQAAATGVTATAFAGVKELWQIDTSAGGGSFQNVTGVGNDMVVGFRGNGDPIGSAVTVTTAGAVPTVKLAFDNVASGSSISAVIPSIGTLHKVEFSGSTVNNGSLSISANADAIESFKGSLSSNTDLALQANFFSALDFFKEVDLSGSIGNIKFDAIKLISQPTFGVNQTPAAMKAFTKLLGGSGNDTLSVSNQIANAGTLTIDAGTGNDRITFVNTKSALAGATLITGGGGNDSFVFTGGSNLVSATSTADLKASLTTITDFNPAQDSLDITGMTLGGRVAQSVVNGAAKGVDLLAIASAVAGVTPVGQHSLFEFAGDTYIYGNIAGAGLQATDALIQLVGVNVASLSSLNMLS